MNIKLITIGDKPPQWLDEGIKTYQKRLNKSLNFELIGLKPIKSGANIKTQEGELLLKASKNASLIIALDEHGKQLTSQQLSQQLSSWQYEAKNVCLLIGGVQGLSDACLNIAQQKWSLSKLTLPHMMARLMVVEQLYRAQSLLAGHPYHKP